MNSKECVDQMEVLHNLLIEEMKQLLGIDPSAPPDPKSIAPLTRRAAVRSISAHIEAMANILRRLASAWFQHHHIFSPAEKALLLDEESYLSESGQVQIRRPRYRSTAGVRFAFQAMTKALGSKFVLDVQSVGWSHVTQTFQIRDRLMHPKTAADLAVTDDETHVALDAIQWFEKQTVLILCELCKSAINDIERLRKEEAKQRDAPV